jgi:putative ABC transport system substrate-binding protein
MEFIATGGLMACGPSYPEPYRGAATYVDKLFNRAKSGDLQTGRLPQSEPTISLKTAEAMGLAISQSLLPRADGAVQ